MAFCCLLCFSVFGLTEFLPEIRKEKRKKKTGKGLSNISISQKRFNDECYFLIDWEREEKWEKRL